MKLEFLIKKFIFKTLLKTNKKVVFYTAIFGNYDLLKDPPDKLAEQYDFVCFTDNEKLISEYYKIILCKKTEKNDSVDSRKYKILPHKFLLKKYKNSIWLDGSIILNYFNVKSFIKKYLRVEKWAVFIHPERDCIYEEAEACVRLQKDDENIIRKQIFSYNEEGYPKKNGLVANGFILREHNNPEVMKISEKWWNEVVAKSKRDQLSFCYIAWKNNFRYSIINNNLWNNDYFKVLKHEKLK